MSVLNSHILCKQMTSKIIHFCDFRLQVIHQIIETCTKPKASTGRSSTGDNPIRLINCHFASFIPTTLTRQYSQRKHRIYAKPKARAKTETGTCYECTECHVGFCVFGCFQNYYTLKYFTLKYF
jgi:hypothetical protein